MHFYFKKGNKDLPYLVFYTLTFKGEHSAAFQNILHLQTH